MIINYSDSAFSDTEPKDEPNDNDDDMPPLPPPMPTLAELKKQSPQSRGTAQ